MAMGMRKKEVEINPGEISRMKNHKNIITAIVRGKWYDRRSSYWIKFKSSE
jgi:uncharacterized beta-barrel protein YwiB (DUF1934 family)